MHLLNIPRLTDPRKWIQVSITLQMRKLKYTVAEGLA